MTDLPDATEPAWLRGLIARRGVPGHTVTERSEGWTWMDGTDGVVITEGVVAWQVVAWRGTRVARLRVDGKPSPVDVSGVIASAGLDDREVST